MKDPRIGFVSITRVEVSGDLAHAKVYVSVLGSDEERNNTMAALKRATGFLRHELAGRLVLRHVPELVFKLDLSLEKGAEVMELIKQIEQEHAQKQQQETSQTGAPAQSETDEEQDENTDAAEAE